MVPVWAASATAATIAINGYWTTPADSANVSILYASADPNADTSSTPPWIAKMWRPTNGWDQAKLDNAQLKVTSDDATPDIGPHAMGLEALVQLAEARPTIGDPADPVATQEIDPMSSGSIAVTVDAPADQDVTLNWSESGTPASQPVSAGGSHTEVLDAPDATVVDYVEVVSENEDPDRP